LFLSLFLVGSLLVLTFFCTFRYISAVKSPKVTRCKQDLKKTELEGKVPSPSVSEGADTERGAQRQQNLTNDYAEANDHFATQMHNSQPAMISRIEHSEFNADGPDVVKKEVGFCSDRLSIEDK